MATSRITINDIREMKKKGEKIPMLTAYDYTTAQLLDRAGIPFLLVGDSLGMVVLGQESTVTVTMEEMIHHIKAVARGAKNALIVGDMPFMSVNISVEEGLRNAARLMQAGAQAVKIEGAGSVLQVVRRLVEAGIPVVGHLGLTPQSINQLGGYRVQGKTTETAQKIFDDALLLEEAGIFALVLEMVPTPLAKLISKRLNIPTIGIGAGDGCDGQVQVIHDLLGLFTDMVPRHAKRYANLGGEIIRVVEEYATEVKSGQFPTAANSFNLSEQVLDGLYGHLNQKMEH